MDTHTTIPVLSDEATRKLDDLIELNIDSSKGFEEAAERFDAPSLSSLFREHSAIRGRFAQELQTIVYANGERPSTSGTSLGTMHRWWLGLRGQIASGEEYAILAEAERGEDAIKHKYEEVLKEGLGDSISQVIARQYVSIKEAHDSVRDMRDRAERLKR